MSPEIVESLVLLLAGQVALALLGFAPCEIGAAVSHALGRPGPPGSQRRSARFWSAAARNAWLLSVLAAVVGFVTLLCSQVGGLSGFVAGAAARGVMVAVGAVMAALLLLPGLRLAGAAERLADGPPEAEPGGRDAAGRPRLATALAYGLLFAALALPLRSPGSGGQFRPADWLLHPPAWLLVGGGALLVALYLGSSAKGSRWAISIAVAGLVGVLAGLGEAAHGFGIASIERVAGGLTLSVGSGFAALVGLAAIGLPHLDRAPEEDTGSPGRVAAWVFPALVLAVLAIALALVLVPMERAAGS